MEIPKRKRLRLESYDYTSCGAYFITVCVKDRRALLWDATVVESTCVDSVCFDDKLLSVCGEIVETAIKQIHEHYDNVVVDNYCIMPDHIHMIVFIMPCENEQTACGRELCGRIISAPTTLSGVIGSMKRWVSKQIGFPIWQKSYYDRVIRTAKEYREMWKYIESNPLVLNEHNPRE